MWEDLHDWWLDELRDPSYQHFVAPVLFGLLDEPGCTGVVADLGSGTGRWMKASCELLGVPVIGIELNATLASRCIEPVIVARLPGIPMAGRSLCGAYAVLVLEHLDDLGGFFKEAARVIISGGFLAVVSNHPVWTAPGSTPIVDTDGENLWRPGRYFEPGTTDEPAGGGHVTFHHRPIGMILESAAAAGWSLVRMIERPHHEAGVDPGVPRLIGIRWLLLP